MKNRSPSSEVPSSDAASAAPSDGGGGEAKPRAARKPSVAASRRAEKAAMHAQTTEAVAPTHDPRAAKASYAPEPAMTTTVAPTTASALRKDPARAPMYSA